VSALHHVKAIVAFRLPDGRVIAQSGWAEGVEMSTGALFFDGDFSLPLAAQVRASGYTNIDWSSVQNFTQVPDWDDVPGPAAEIDNRREIEG
jgi:hypothetical protein